MTVWDDVAHRIREIARTQVHNVAPPPRRFKVAGTSPLVMEAVDGSPDRIEHGDEDVEVDERVLATAAEGDLVHVHEDEDGDYLVGGLVKDEVD